MQLNEKIQKAEQRREKSEMERKRRRDGVDALINAISQRGVRVAGGLENARFANGSSQITEFSPSMLFPIPDNVDLKPTYTDGSLCWPVCLVYPQLETWDLISDWHEQTNVKTQLDTVLTSERDDLSEEYSVNWSNNLAIYIPVEIKGKKLEWKRIALFQSLQTVLTLQGAVVAEDGIVRLWIMPKPVKGGWTEQWLSNSL